MYGVLPYGSQPYGMGIPGTVDEDLQLSIGGKHTGDYAEGSLNMQQSLDGRTTLRFRLTDKANSISLKFGMPVKVRLRGRIIFGGTIHRYSRTFPGTAGTVYSTLNVRCVDYNKIADRKTVSFVYPQQLAGDIVRDLVQTKLSSEGVNANMVKDGITVGPIRFQSAKVSQALDKIANLIGYSWWIDERKTMHFIDRTARAAPWNISASERTYQSLTFEETGKDYRNVQFVRGGKDIGASRTRKFSGDGETTVFHVDAPIATVPTVRVDTGGGFVTKTVGIRGIDDDNDATGFDWFWSKGETGVSQNRTATALGATHVIEISFEPLFQLFTQVADFDAIAERRAVEGGSGRYEAVATDAEIEDAVLSSDLGNMLLRKHARINSVVKVNTLEPGIRPGDLQRIELPSEGPDDDFLITDVSLRDLGGLNCIFTYTAIDNENPGGWQNFWKKTIDFGRQLSIGGSETVTDAIVEGETVIVSDDSSGTATGNNLDPISSDKYSFFGVDVGVGGRLVIDGQVINHGAVIGQFANPT